MKTNVNYNIIVKCNDIEQAKDVYYNQMFDFYSEFYSREQTEKLAQESLTLFVEHYIKGDYIHTQMHDFFYHFGRENYCGSTLFHPEIEVIEEH